MQAYNKEKKRTFFSTKKFKNSRLRSTNQPVKPDQETGGRGKEHGGGGGGDDDDDIIRK